MSAAEGRVLKYTVVRVHPDTMTAEALLEGTEVPEWAENLVSADGLTAAGDGDGGSGQDDKPLAKLNVKELEAEIALRNDGRDEDALITPAGTKKADLVAALEADDLTAAGDGDGGSGQDD